MNFDNRHAAETQVCTAIANLGRLAGIDVDLGEGPEDIAASLIQAAYESNFNDPDFLGGPGCFEHPDDVAALDARARRVTRGLARYIARRGGAMDQAHAQLAVVEDAFCWLRSHLT